MRVIYSKHFTGGLLEGLTIEETMPFVSMSDAIDWAETVTASKKVEFTISELRNWESE